MNISFFGYLGMLMILQASTKEYSTFSERLITTEQAEKSPESRTFQVIIRYLMISNWRRILFITDYDNKQTYRTLSDFSIMASVIQILSTANQSDAVDPKSPSNKVVVFCSLNCQKYTIEWMCKNNMLLKQYFWLFVTNSLDVQHDLVNLLILMDNLRPDSNVFQIRIPNWNSKGEVEYHLCKLVALGIYSPNGIPCVEERLVKRQSWQLSIHKSIYRPLQGYNLTAAVIHLPPFVTVSERNSGIYVTGYSATITSMLSMYLGFSYKFKKSSSNDYGSLLDNGTWTGLIGLLSRKEADFVAIPLAMTPDRLASFDFSLHTSELGIYAIIRKPTSNPAFVADFWTYTQPFPSCVWLAITTFCILIVFLIILAIIQRPVSERKPKSSSVTSSAADVLWMVVFAVVLKDEIDIPKKNSIHLLKLFLFVFTLLITLSYSSVLTASLTVKKTSGVYETMEALLNDGKYRIAVKKASMELAAIKAAKSGTLRRIKEKMQLVANDGEGIAKAYEENFVYLMPHGLVDHLLKENCSFTFIKQKLIKSTVHLALQKNSPFREAFSQMVLSFHSSVTLSRLQNPKYDPNVHCPTTEDFTSVALSKCAGAFMCFIFGIGISLFVLHLELLCDLIRKKISL